MKFSQSVIQELQEAVRQDRGYDFSTEDAQMLADALVVCFAPLVFLPENKNDNEYGTRTTRFNYTK